MNRKEAEKTAREITWRACMLGEDVSADLEEMSRNGYEMERAMIAGFDGFTIGAQYIAAPRTRKPGKKQHCTAYGLSDVRMYAEACDAVAAENFATAQRIYDRLGSASLRNALSEGLEYLYSQFTCEEIAEKMDEPENITDMDAVVALFGSYGFEIEQKRPGCCIWVSGDTKPHRDELKSFGFRWSPKRTAWYWRPAA